MPFSVKQQEYLDNATKRWNIKTGATASGKTWLDYTYVIPRRITKCNDDGLIVLIGNNINSIERNVLAPMREIWPGLVSPIRQGNNTVSIFGKKCFVMGADKVNQVARLQGATIEYAYGDEVTTWNREVFEMLKSRLRTPNSRFDGTCNPSFPQHWFKEFLDGDFDTYQQAYTLDDNPFLPPEFVANLKQEYAGTVYYDRFVLGRWVAAEGLIYQQFADDEERYLVTLNDDYLKDVDFVSIGIDFGGTRSLTTFVATAIHRNFSKITTIADHHIKGSKGEIDADRVCDEFIGFIQRLRAKWPFLFIKYVFADSEAQYLINSLRKAIIINNLGLEIGDSGKYPITDRIVARNTLLNTGRAFVSEDCGLLRGGLRSALWDNKKPDTRLDNFSTDIDILDGDEYSWERFIPRLCPLTKVKKVNR